MKLRQLIDDICIVRLLKRMPESIEYNGLTFYLKIKRAFGWWHAGYVNDDFCADLYDFHYPELKDAIKELYKTIKEKQNEE